MINSLLYLNRKKTIIEIKHNMCHKEVKSILKDEPTQDINHRVLQFSKNEKEIMECIGNGESNTEIAKKLLLSVDKINKIIENMLFKTETKNLAHLMMYSVTNKVLDINY